MTIFVTNPSCTATYLKEYDGEIQGWLEKHYGCKLHLIHLDPDYEEILEAGFTIVKPKKK